MIKETTAFSTTSGVVYKSKDEARKAELYDFIYKQGKATVNFYSYPLISSVAVDYIIENKEEFISFLKNL